MRCLLSWLQCVSRVRSFHCQQVRSKGERHLPFAARFVGNIGPVSIRQIHAELLLAHSGGNHSNGNNFSAAPASSFKPTSAAARASTVS
jgi:hypothetical protein